MIVADAGLIIAFTRIGRLALPQQAVGGALIVLGVAYEELVVKGSDRPRAEEIRRGGGMQRCTLRNRQALAQHQAVNCCGGVRYTRLIYLRS